MADERIQIIIEGQDKLSGPAKTANASLSQLGASAQKTMNHVEGFGAASAHANKSVGMLSIGVQGMLQVAAGIGVYRALTEAVSGVGDAVMGFNARMEQSKIGFTTMLGGAAQADAMLEKLYAFAAKTPFEFPDLVKSTQKLLAFGFAGDDIIPMMTSIGDAVAGLGGGAFEIDRVTRALGQMKAKGKVSAEEMMQMAELGIPAWDMLAKGIGKSTAETMKLSEKGLIPADAAIKALLAGMEERFPAMMEAQSKTFQGMMSTLRDTVVGGIAKAGKPIFEFAKSGLSAILGFITDPSIGNALGNLGRQMETAFGGGNFAPLLSNLQKIGSNIAARVQEWGKAFIDWVGPATLDLLSRLGSLADTLVQWIVAQIPSWTTQLGQWAKAFIDWVLVAIPGLFRNLAKLWESIYVWIINTAPGLMQRFISEWVPAAIEWVVRAAIDIMPKLAGFLLGVGQWILGTAVPRITELALKMGTALVLGTIQGIWSLAGKLWDAIQGLFLYATDQQDIYGLGQTVGEEYMAGMRNAVAENKAQIQKDLDAVNRQAQAQKTIEALKKTGLGLVGLGRGFNVLEFAQKGAGAAAANLNEELAKTSNIPSATPPPTSFEEKTNKATDAMKKLRDQMQGIADLKLFGETAISDQLFRMGQDAKKLELQILEMGGAGAESAKPYSDALASLRTEMEKTRLKAEIEFEPQRRMIERMVNPIMELGLQEKLDNIISLSPETRAGLEEAARAMGLQVSQITKLSGLDSMLGGMSESWTVVADETGRWVATLQDAQNTLGNMDFPAAFVSHLEAIGSGMGSPDVGSQWEEWRKLQGFQTEPGEWRRIPGGVSEPIPILAHGGELIGRPNSSVSNNIRDNRQMTVIINNPQGNVVDRFATDPRVKEQFKPRQRW